MSYPIQIVEIDLSFFTGCISYLAMTAEESRHGYDYTVTYYYDDEFRGVQDCKQQWVLYDQRTADHAAEFMLRRLKEILG